jgi:hypothetical protein
MIAFVVHTYGDWEKDFVKFERELAKHKLKVNECVIGVEEILIGVSTKKYLERDLVAQLARKSFVVGYAGIL